MEFTWRHTGHEMTMTSTQHQWERAFTVIHSVCFLLHHWTRSKYFVLMDIVGHFRWIFVRNLQIAFTPKCDLFFAVCEIERLYTHGHVGIHIKFVLFWCGGRRRQLKVTNITKKSCKNLQFLEVCVGKAWFCYAIRWLPTFCWKRFHEIKRNYLKQ